MKTNVKKTRRGFTLVELLVVIVIIATLAGLASPMVIRQRKKADQTEAVSNAKNIGLALFEFDTDYGAFPGAATQTQVTANFPTSVINGTTGSSNGFFKQLFEAGVTQSEAMFYVKIPGSIKPDGKIDTNTDALKAGECGFAYITDGTEGMSSSGNPSRAVVCTPFATGENFLGDPFDKKAVILRIDNSATSVNIAVPAGNTTNSGPAIVGGTSLLATANPIWGATAPTVQAPLK